MFVSWRCGCICVCGQITNEESLCEAAVRFSVKHDHEKRERIMRNRTRGTSDPRRSGLPPVLLFLCVCVCLLGTTLIMYYYHHHLSLFWTHELSRARERRAVKFNLRFAYNAKSQ